MCFGHNVLDTITQKKTDHQANLKNSKPKYVHKSVILKSRPLKFTSTRKLNKPHINYQTSPYTPMCDNQLNKMLDNDQHKIQEAYGYTEKVMDKLCDDEIYGLDSCGLKLIDGEEPTVLYSANEGESISDRELAASFGYADTGTNVGAELDYCDTTDTEDIAAEFGYGTEVDPDASSACDENDLEATTTGNELSSHEFSSSQENSESSSDSDVSSCEESSGENSGDSYDASS